MTTDHDHYMIRHVAMRRFRQEARAEIFALLEKLEEKYRSPQELRMLAEVFEGAHQKAFADSLDKEREERARTSEPKKARQGHCPTHRGKP